LREAPAEGSVSHRKAHKTRNLVPALLTKGAGKSKAGASRLFVTASARSGAKRTHAKRDGASAG